MDLSNDANFMKNYLFHAMTFERYVYIWNRALKSSGKVVSQIQAQKGNCHQGLNQTQRTLEEIDEDYVSAKIYNKNQKNKAKKNIFKIIIAVAILFVLLVIGLILVISEIEIGALLMFPFMMISSVVPFVLLIFGYKFLKSKYNGDKYTDAAKEYERQRLLNDIANYESSLEAIISKETVALQKHEEIKRNLNYALNVRSKIYSLNVLDQSYRSLIATATLYQYLKSGVCTTIKGTGGIYQTYLYHSQLKTIITQLSEINEKLDIVISNQRMLYDEMTKANATLKSIEKEVKEINSGVSDVKHSAEISAAAQRQTADAASYMAYVTWHNQ